MLKKVKRGAFGREDHAHRPRDGGQSVALIDTGTVRDECSEFEPAIDRDANVLGRGQSCDNAGGSRHECRLPREEWGNNVGSQVAHVVQILRQRSTNQVAAGGSLRR